MTSCLVEFIVPKKIDITAPSIPSALMICLLVMDVCLVSLGICLLSMGLLSMNVCVL